MENFTKGPKVNWS